MNANEFVATRLVWARALSGWTQEEVATRLGGGWTRVGVSAAERSHTGARTRRFDAEDLAAFSRVFGLPVSFWFAPEYEGDWHARAEEMRQRRLAELERPLYPLEGDPVPAGKEEQRS